MRQKQAEKPKSREMKEVWWMTNDEKWVKDEWRMMKDEWRMIKDEEWTMKDDDLKLLRGFCDRRTNEQMDRHLWL